MPALPEIKSALITGIGGSGGSYMAEYILKHQPGVKVHGIARPATAETSENLHGLRDDIDLIACDLKEKEKVIGAIHKIRPDIVFHLASNANVRYSFDAPREILENNIQATTNVFEAVHHYSKKSIVVHCSTSEVYGLVSKDEVPIKETAPMRPASPYAVSKVVQDLLAYSYFKAYGLHMIRTRMFTYFNPRRKDLFASSFARQVARIEAGLQDELTHGNLNSIRTMIDVRDAMESYWLAAIHGKPGGIYNIGGDKQISVGEFLDVLKKLSTVPIKSRVDKALLRPTDVTLQIPCLHEFSEITGGWKPKIPFEQSVEHLLNHWRQVIRGSHSISGR